MSDPHHHPSLAQDAEAALASEAAPYTLAPPISATNLPSHADLPRIVEPPAASRIPSSSASSATPNMDTLHPNPTQGTLPSANATAVASRAESVKDGSTSPASPATTNGQLEKTNSHPTVGSDKDNEKAQGETEPDTGGLLSGMKLYLVFLALMLCVFMFALDQSIVSTAIPEIVSSFQAFDEVPWIVTGYFLTQCGLIMLVGQLLTVLKAKWMLLGAIFFFELGSLLCGVANGMPLLIFARALQGVGASGMFVSILAVIAVITTLRQRPAFMGAFGVVFVISSVVGPLLGGVFTERVTWRWCFYINLPIGGLSALAVVFLLPAVEPQQDGLVEAPKGWQGLKKMDYIGSIIILSLVTCLLLALQWGGNNYPWGNWRIILLFVLGGVLVPIFFLWEWKLDKRALIPLTLLKNRTLVACSATMFFMMYGMLGGTYQLPLYYQVGRDHTPQQSGIDIIPFMLSTCVGIFVSGGGGTATGRYWPFLVAGAPIAAVGFGLMYTIDFYTANAKIIGYQILTGFGIGLSFQNALIAVQAEYNDRPHLIPQATSVVSFFQLTGAAIGIGIVNTVQSVYLNEGLEPLAAIGVPVEVVRQSTIAVYQLPEAMQLPVINAYINAITKSIIPLIAALCLAEIAAVFVKNHNMKAKGVTPGAAAV